MSTQKLQLQKLERPKGRAMLEWYGKKAPKSVEFYPAQIKEGYGNQKAKDWNRLFWGDNKQVLAHLLKEYRGQVDLIYIDPPFDSKANYVKRLKIKGNEIEGVEQGILEEMQYADIWEKDEYLQFMYERLLILRELLSDKGSIYLHCDWHRSSYLRLLLDEVFGEDNFRNEIVWSYFVSGKYPNEFAKDHDNIFVYSKTNTPTFNYEKQVDRLLYLEKFYKKEIITGEDGKEYYKYNGEPRTFEKQVSETWNINKIKRDGIEIVGYPTQKPELLLERIIKASSNDGDLIMDCFSGSGTTLAVAQKLGRRWIGCDINKGALIASTERLNKIIKDSQGLDAFKVYTVNHYDIFKNEEEAKNILIKLYKVERVSRGYFDGTLGTDLVKIISPNRVLSKMDIRGVIDGIKKEKDVFRVKRVSKHGDSVYENKVVIICSGTELDARDFVKKENNTGVQIEIRDIQIDKKELDFKKPTEASIDYKTKGDKLTVSVKDYYSPLLMKRLELENENRLNYEERVRVFDFRQAIEHIVIDVNYGKGQKKSHEFNADIFLHKPKKTELVATTYEYTYDKKGKYTVGVKIVDVLGEEYFETHQVEIK